MPDIMESETEKVSPVEEMTAQLGKTEHEYRKDTGDCSKDIIPDDLLL